MTTFDGSWVIVSITEDHYNQTQRLNTTYATRPEEYLQYHPARLSSSHQADTASTQVTAPPAAQASNGGSSCHLTSSFTNEVVRGPPTSVGPSRYERQETAPIEDRWRAFGLGPKNIPSFVFGRISHSRYEDLQYGSSHCDTDPDFILDRSPDDRTGRASSISTRHFRIYFNEHNVWMFEDTSRNGCIVNGVALVSRRRAPRSAAHSIALRPDRVNTVDLRVLQLKISIGRERPLLPFTVEDAGLSCLDLEAQTMTEGLGSESSDAASVPRTFDYYELEGVQEQDRSLLMSQQDGKCYLGYRYVNTMKAQDNYRMLRPILELGKRFGICPIVDGVLHGDTYVAITSLGLGESLETTLVDPATLSYVMLQVLEKLVFLHSQGVKHGNVSSKTIIVEDGRPVETLLAGINLGESDMRSGLADDLCDLGTVIQSALEAQGLAWRRTPLGPCLEKCLSKKYTAERLLQELQKDEIGGRSWPLSPTISISRTFTLRWRLDSDHGALVRKSDIDRVVRSMRNPRRTSPVAVADLAHGDMGEDKYIIFSNAQKVLDTHHISDDLTEPANLDPANSLPANFTVERKVLQHTASGMCNITQVLDLLQDFQAVDQLPKPDAIQDVRGDPATAGFYIAEESFVRIMQAIQKHVQVEYRIHRTSRRMKNTFELSDFSSCIQVHTGWVIPKFLELSRVEGGTSTGSNFCSSVHHCQQWFRQLGMPAHAQYMDAVQDLCLRDWTAVPAVKRGVDDSFVTPPRSSVSSDYTFRPGRKRARHCNDVRVVTEEDSSGNESEALTVIPCSSSEIHRPSTKAPDTTQRVLDWRSRLSPAPAHPSNSKSLHELPPNCDSRVVRRWFRTRAETPVRQEASRDGRLGMRTTRRAVSRCTNQGEC